ncbi:MAG: alpha/beta fold hydrolase, partial [Streptosporangiaceae bacterium]
MHRHPAQTLDSERGGGRRGQAAMAWRAGAAAAPRAGAAAAVPAGQARRDQQRAQAVASVVCLHASASSGRQWQALGRRLAGRYRVLSPDLYGAGNSPPWPAERE